MQYISLQNNTLDLSVPFVYVPLHRQPEGSVNPMGGKYVDQIAITQMLSRAVPEGWKVYVKEHPTQWNFPLAHIGRYNGYYQRIKKSKNVELVPMNVSSFDLISNCRSVTTVTGTASMEAVFMGKPSLIFGGRGMHCCTTPPFYLPIMN